MTSANLNQPGFWSIWIILGVMGFLAVFNVAHNAYHRYRIHRKLEDRKRRLDVKAHWSVAEKHDAEVIKPIPQAAHAGRGSWWSAMCVCIDEVLYRRLPRELSGYNMTQTSFVAAYLGINLGLCFYGTSAKTPTAWVNQSGLIATSQLLVIVALAGKNNILSLITGVSYEKLNYLHRAAGRAAFLFSWMHAGYYLHVATKKTFAVPFIQWGLVAIISYSLIVVLSYSSIRNRAYEVFLYSHMVLVMLLLISVLLHRIEFVYWVAPAMILWGLDRLVRLGKLIWANALWRPSTYRNRGLEAEVTSIGTNTLMISMNRPDFTWTAGQHLFVTMPSVSRFPIEAHVFTILGAPTYTGPDAGKVSLIVSERRGATSRLRHASCTTKIYNAYIDGPYGNASSLLHYDTVVLFAGGSGITQEISQLVRIIRAVKEGKSCVRRVVLVWMIRDEGNYEGIRTMLLAELEDLPLDLSIDVRIHMTHAATILPRKGSAGHNSVGSGTSTDSSTDLTLARTVTLAEKIEDEPASDVPGVMEIMLSKVVSKVANLEPETTETITMDPIAETDADLDLEAQLHSLANPDAASIKGKPKRPIKALQTSNSEWIPGPRPSEASRSMDRVSWEAGRIDVLEMLQMAKAKTPREGLVGVEVCGPHALVDSATLAVRTITKVGPVARGEAPRFVLYTESYGS